jgi:hypothetical protein
MHIFLCHHRSHSFEGVKAFFDTIWSLSYVELHYCSTEEDGCGSPPKSQPVDESKGPKYLNIKTKNKHNHTEEDGCGSPPKSQRVDESKGPKYLNIKTKNKHNHTELYIKFELKKN